MSNKTININFDKAFYDAMKGINEKSMLNVAEAAKGLALKIAHVFGLHGAKCVDENDAGYRIV